MEILHLSDIHIELKRDKRYRKDLITSIRFILDTIEERKPNYVFIAGDLFNTKLPTSGERSLANAFIRRILDLNTHLVIVPGNHDIPAKEGSHHTLSPIESLALPNLHVLSETGIYTVGDIDVLAMPYVYLNQEDELAKIQELHDEYTGDNLFAIGHFWVTGSVPGITPPSNEYVVPVELLQDMTKVKYGALGHIHKAGFVYGNWAYGGSPFRWNLGEKEPNKSIYMWDEGNVETIVTPAMPIYEVDIRNVPQEVYALDSAIVKIVAKGVTVEALPKVDKLYSQLSKTNNFAYIDLNLQDVTFETATDTTLTNSRAFMDDWIKKNDLVAEKDIILGICDKIQNETLTKNDSPFDLEELGIDDTEKPKT